MKQCNDCHKTLPFTDFTKKSSCKDGYEPRCKVCRTIRYNKSSAAKVVKRIYSTQLINSARRCHTPPSYTESELLTWIIANPSWATLYEQWQLSSYSKELKPSVDRIDSNEPYSLTNIQLVTWQENRQNSRQEMINGEVTGQLRPVTSYTKEGVLCKSYYSIAQAIKDIKGTYWGISTVANGVPVRDGKGHLYTPRTYKGLVWKWS